MHDWVDRFAESLRGQGVAIDGKVLRGSFDKATGQSAFHTITAFATETRLCLRQMKVDDKSNEIPAVPELLKLLDLEGAIVTLDAMHCQKETARAIGAAGAEYILTVKDNQPSLYALLHDLFIDAEEEDSTVKLRRHSTPGKAHGRNELREHVTMAAPGNHELPPKVKAIAKHIRGHWSIENSRHHVLDVTFTEDSSRIRKGTGPEIAAGIRRMALNILQQDTTIKDNIKGKRERCGWSEDALDRLYYEFSRLKELKDAVCAAEKQENASALPNNPIRDQQCCISHSQTQPASTTRSRRGSEPLQGNRPAWK